MCHPHFLVTSTARLMTVRVPCTRRVSLIFFVGIVSDVSMIRLRDMSSHCFMMSFQESTRFLPNPTLIRWDPWSLLTLLSHTPESHPSPAVQMGQDAKAQWLPHPGAHQRSAARAEPSTMPSTPEVFQGHLEHLGTLGAPSMTEPSESNPPCRSCQLLTLTSH